MREDEFESLVIGGPGLRKATIAPKGPELGHEPKIAFPAADGFIIIPSQQLVRLEADGGYTWVYQLGGPSQLVSRRLGDLHRHLPAGRFFRCHHGHVINLGFAVM